MSAEAPCKPLHGDEMAHRIRQLTAQGLRIRDISSLLNIHPMLVIRVLERARVNDANESLPERKEAPHASP